LTISVAESCTGGYTSYLLTKIPGSSKVFKSGVVVYSLDAKSKLFGISRTLLKETEGVSKKTACLLSQKVRKKFNTDIGASVVGFAGPYAKKGIRKGTVFLSVSYSRETIVKKIIIDAPRDTVRRKAAKSLIELIYRQVTGFSRTKK
ncbi:MAG: competence/damage-inducible protein A, partial [Deltaproteobacteria bacterium]